MLVAVAVDCAKALHAATAVFARATASVTAYRFAMKETLPIAHFAIDHEATPFMIPAGLTGVYLFLYITLRQQDYVLLIGAIALFIVLCVTRESRLVGARPDLTKAENRTIHFFNFPLDVSPAVLIKT